jgi:hypothetical protein
MSNEIIMFQLLYRHLEYLFFSLMKVKIINLSNVGHVLSMAQNSHKLFFFFNYIAIRHLVFVTLIDFTYINT